jgi:hypothetical protein
MDRTRVVGRLDVSDRLLEDGGGAVGRDGIKEGVDDFPKRFWIKMRGFEMC